MNRAPLNAALCAAALAMAASCPPATHAQAYPVKTVRIIVPHPPGGPGDVPPRGIAQALTLSLGQSFIVENREGADGLIGAEACAKAPADGYTLCQTSNGVMIINPSLRREKTYDFDRDFAAIVHTGALYSYILATPSTPGDSMQALLAHVKANPESVTVGTYGAINLASLFVKWTKAQLGVSFYQVPYKSASQGLQAALAGQVQVVSFAMGQGTKLVAAGKLKALAINSSRRLPQIPEVPTLKETGVDMEFRSWFGWFAPKKTPEAIVRRLNAEIAKIIADPQVKAKFIASQGLATDYPTGASPEDFVKYIHEERENFAKLAKIAGIAPQ